MAITVIDPLRDPRWPAFVLSHPRATVFHTAGWLETLERTYGYQPVVLTTASPGSPLEDALPMCRVRVPWRARSRLVSLPFTDHCEPLVQGDDGLDRFAAHLVDEVNAGRAGAVEIRPRGEHRPAGLMPSSEYVLHTLDLTPPREEIFRRFHASSTRRAIRRAEREGLVWHRGRHEPALTHFHRLLTMTRRRHGVPPPPLQWFRMLVACLDDAVEIHVASKDGRPVAAMLTLGFRDGLVYKYGGSDAAYHPLGAMPFLFWQVIQWARERGYATMDLGRSDLDQPGLIGFKDRLGATRTTLTYYSYPPPRAAGALSRRLSALGRAIAGRLPERLLVVAGRALYRYMG